LSKEIIPKRKAVSKARQELETTEGLPREERFQGVSFEEDLSGGNRI